MTATTHPGGNRTRMLRSTASIEGASMVRPPTNQYLLMLAAAITTLLAVACSQLPHRMGIKCTVEPKPVESPATHDASTTGTEEEILPEA